MRPLNRRSLRTKLLLNSVAAITAGLFLIGTLLFFQFRSFFLKQLKSKLKTAIVLANKSLNRNRFRAGDSLYLKQFADRYSTLAGSRVTLISRRGRVLADSQVPIDQLKQVENHLQRPEVQEALKNGVGFAIRHSATANLDLLYGCMPVAGGGFLRFALPMETIQRSLQKAMLVFALGGAAILIISTFLMAFLSRGIKKNLWDLVAESQKMAAGNLDRPLELRSGDELEILAENLNKMAARLSDYLRRLEQEHWELNTVLATINEGIIDLNARGEVVFWNRNAGELLELSDDKTSGNPYHQAIRNKEIVSLLDNFYRTRVVLTSEVLSNKGAILEVTVAAKDKDPAQKSGCVVLLRDITQFKKLERIRKDFVANVSHEFKTPLAAIRGYGESLLDWGLKDPEVNVKYLKKIIRQSKQLEHLVSDLLQLARIERLTTLKLSSFDPLPVLNDLSRQFAEAAGKLGLNFVSDVRLSGEKIKGDPEMFRSIMVNLLDNALKYTPAGGNVTLQAIKRAREVEFSVEDSGIGIPEDEQQRIFERFYRVDKARSRDSGGTGLGLSIVKHLCELQEAQIALSSEIDRGSRFTVSFKQAQSG